MRLRTQKAGGTAGRRGLGSLVPFAMAVCVAVFLWGVSLFYSPKTGFTSLISIGDILDATKVTALRKIPHHVYQDSAGYDGAYYAQLALYPTLDNPELKQAIDNLPYRARRILFCWTAWLLGLGQPAWIVQAHSLLNVICWLGLAVVLLRWFPPTNWNNFLRWFGIMFSHGVGTSVRHSLVDAPSLLLVAVAMAWMERGSRRRAGAVLALAGLGKETSVLAVAGLFDPTSRSWRNLARFALTALAIVFPLLAWMAYVRFKFGPAEDPGLGNFTLPFFGLAEKWAEAVQAFLEEEDPWVAWGVVSATLAVTVQLLFIAVGRRWTEPWWRVGAMFALMTVFLSTPVWEGFPGAFTRVLLPMSLAFNVIVPRGRRWLPLLVAGNLSVLSTYREVGPPAEEFIRVQAEPQVAKALTVTPGPGWYGPEEGSGVRWRWSSGESWLRIQNASAGPLALTLHGRIAGTGPRHVKVFLGEVTLWSGDILEKSSRVDFDCVVPPGESKLRFAADQPARNVGGDPRRLSFNVSNLDIVARPSLAPP
ncbi:MAG: hypothetical protein Q7S40_04820 [Opitutaceae bacterium]|nr:hypothetical protein [Opitutaceae bacterium]